jgi:hypothetical protein
MTALHAESPATSDTASHTEPGTEPDTGPDAEPYGPLDGDLAGHLDADARRWLAAACAQAADHAPGWELRFAEAGRTCGPTDTARMMLLTAARPDAATVTRLYQQGTTAERRAILLALPRLSLDPADGVPLLEDALRTNDTGLVAAALGPYAALHLPPHAWRHAVLKCLFAGVPLAAAADLAGRARADAELARMLTDYAAERTAAGRTVPEDLRHLLALTEER